MSTKRHLDEDRGRVLGLDNGVDALRESAEFRGPIEPLDGHDHANDHFALVYDDRAERLAATVPFLRQGLDAGEKCLYVGDERSLETVVDLLRDRGVDVDGAVESGSLVFASVQDTYLRDGSFDPESMMEVYGTEIEAATAEFEALRVVAETGWIVENGVPIEAFMEYESRINELFDGADAIALCQYDRERFPAEELIEIVRVHPHLIYDTTVCHNVYYTPPAEFCGPDRPERELDRMLGTLRERAQAKASLHGQTEALRSHHALASRSDLSFDEKLGRFLELGCEYLRLDIGFLSHTANGRFELVDAVGDHELIQPGLTANPMETYCRRVLESDGLVAVDDAPTAGWTDDRAYEIYDLDSYVGTTVTVGDERYGTLCFAAREARDRSFSEAERTFLELTAQWIGYELEREQCQAQLAALNEMSRDLMDAEGESAIAEATVAHAGGTLALPLTAVVQYDRAAGGLETAARTERATDELPTAALSETPSGSLWEAFTAGETRVVDGDVSGAGDDVTEIAAVPLGSHGVFVTATEANGGFTEAALEFVETTAATVETACGRAGRERLLAERERTLEEQNDSLERLNRINDTIRSIGQSLVGASTRGEIETVVCEQLADVGPYELAWVGDHDPVTDEVTPREWAGAEKGYLDATTVTADERTTGRGPAGRAVRTRETRVVDNIVEDPDFEPWRQAALTRGYHASIALPLVYDDALYGVLNVYANQPGVFDELERSVLAELADTIAYAINAVESKRSLVSDEVTELEFAVGDDDLGVVELACETGCDLTLEGIVPTPDGRPRAYASTRGVPAEELRAAAVDLETSEPTLVSEYEDGDEPVCLFEATLGERSLCETARRHGGRPRSLTASEGTATLVVELGVEADVREFVAAFGDAYADTELVAQRSRERPRRSPTELRATLTEELTDRQLEVLQTAYFGGYFATPRGRTGSEVAESLGISQPTFNTHVRAAHRKLCRQLFESGGPDR
ncbi:response regulator receiver modulated GAF sensor protein [Halosimplex carlsbadense 2-9-1]|uniref:Response regulator receiver modulated GAF sensor protein n=1 Tax=Halosimplex carlsbadense 2-9-1 TaxID=797114 RepID=M0CP49_9EURY|nr:MEDS domain-containing protein [Halosimplex carlsbadense]ELZ23654.1 response regulator receiver modulated GAF sensor protein [Halosimplex carlsbadense 2-9-1]